MSRADSPAAKARRARVDIARSLWRTELRVLARSVALGRLDPAVQRVAVLALVKKATGFRLSPPTRVERTHEFARKLDDEVADVEQRDALLDDDSLYSNRGLDLDVDAEVDALGEQGRALREVLGHARGAARQTMKPAELLARAVFRDAPELLTRPWSEREFVGSAVRVFEPVEGHDDVDSRRGVSGKLEPNDPRWPTCSWRGILAAARAMHVELRDADVARWLRGE